MDHICVTCRVLEAALRASRTPTAFITAEVNLERHRLTHVQDEPTVV